MQFVSKYTSSLCSSSKVFLGGYLSWILCPNGFLWYNICKGWALPRVQLLCSKEKWTSQFNLFLQPTWVHSELACESTVMIQRLKPPIRPTINCHFRHLWQTVNTCLSGNCTLQAQPMVQYFLSNQWLIRELNKNKGYTIRSPPFYLCSIKM